jgi:hypothetical protein
MATKVFVGGQLGNVERDFMTAFNRLRDRRSGARYLRTEQLPTVDECTAMLTAITDRIEDIRKSFDPRRV